MSACDAIYNVYRDMCRAAKDGTVVNVGAVRELLDEQVARFAAALPVRNDNA